MNALARVQEAGDILLECVSVRQETPEAKTYVFASPSGPLDFEPGQFLNFFFDINGEEHLRSYSISSSATSGGWVSITVKRVKGGRVSNWLYDTMRPGTRVRASGPAGQFGCGLEPTGPLLLLTAGSGITPAASMLRSLADRASQSDIVLIHFASSPDDMIFREDMRHWARLLPGLRVIPVVTRHHPCGGWVGPVGRLSGELLQGLVPDAGSRAVYCCGPAGFMELAETTLARLGLPRDRFFTESFDRAREEDDAVAEPAGDVRHTISFAKSGSSIAADPDMTVLKAAKALGVRIQTSCGKGICGTCCIRMLSGTVEIRHQGGIKQRQIDQGYILACCSRPTSDVVIEK